jgi:hypothetical protein
MPLTTHSVDAPLCMPTDHQNSATPLCYSFNVAPPHLTMFHLEYFETTHLAFLFYPRRLRLHCVRILNGSGVFHRIVQDNWTFWHLWCIMTNTLPASFIRNVSKWIMKCHLPRRDAPPSPFVSTLSPFFHPLFHFVQIFFSLGTGTPAESLVFSTIGYMYKIDHHARRSCSILFLSSCTFHSCLFCVIST